MTRPESPDQASRGPAPAGPAVAERFEREATRWDQIYDRSGPWPVRGWNALTRGNVTARFDAAFAAVPDWSGVSVLDIGCGSGRFLVRAAGLGAARLVGIDPAPAMIAIAQRQLATFDIAAELIVGSFPDATAEGPFDVILLVGVMDYVTEPEMLMAGVSAAGADRVIVTFPWRLAPRSLPRAAYWRLRGLPTRYYRRSDVARLVSGAGLRVEKMDRIGPIVFVVARPASPSNPS